MAFNSSITGVGDGWGGAFGAGLAQLRLYEDFAKDKRRKATYMFPGDRYSYITQEIDSAGKKWKRPRIVPYNANNNSYNLADTGKFQLAWIKKYVVGRPEDNEGQVATMSTAINTYMMRLPEVYLTLAEAVLGNAPSTTNAEVVNAVNKVRTRAGLDAKTEITWYDIYKERMIEFAFEGFSSLDFTRLMYYNPSKCFQMLSDMNRGFYILKPKPDIYNATSWELSESNQSNDQDFVTVSQDNYYLPIPELELAQASWLLGPAKLYVPKAD